MSRPEVLSDDRPCCHCDRGRWQRQYLQHPPPHTYTRLSQRAEIANARVHESSVKEVEKQLAACWQTNAKDAAAKCQTRQHSRALQAQELLLAMHVAD